jgi:thermostable 8-oxoguanine DNA glycosylase
MARPLSPRKVKLKVQDFIAHVPKYIVNEYIDYFNSVAPKSEEDFFRRWLFAWASIQTTWERNCLLYNNIKDLSWMDSKDDLYERVHASRAGLTNNRTKYIWEFREKYWDDTDFFRKKGDRTWVNYRKDLLSNILGIGYTKCAFVCEMSFPNDSEVVCLDTHMLQLMGYTVNSKEKMSYKKYLQLEKIWVDTCWDNKVPPAIGRAICWDIIQGKTDSSYWCNVFHDEAQIPRHEGELEYA